jgi:hypothetical protein
MRPWGTFTGRVVDEQGRPQPGATITPDPGILPGVQTDEQGRFRLERLLPGQSYGATLYLGIGRPSGPAFEGLKVAPGRVRDLGDLRLGTPIGADP